MALQKQNISVNFSQGLDTKTDPLQIPPGKFLSLTNTVFTKAGLLQKRNGFGRVTSIPGASSLATYRDGLIGLSSTLQSYSPDNNALINGGSIQPMSVTAQSLVRSATSQTTADVAVSSTGLACSVWLDSDTNSYYQISDSVTGITVVAKTQLPSTATMGRVNVVGPYFVITFMQTVGSAHLRFIAVPIFNPSSPTAVADLSAQVNGLTAGYDAVAFNNRLYFAWVSSVATNPVKVSYLTSQLAQSAVATVAGETGNLISIAPDSSNGNIWISIYKSAANTIRSTVYNSELTGAVLAPTTVVSSITINEITSNIVSGVLNIFYEVANTYGFSPNAKSDYLSKNTLTLAGVVGTPAIICRGVGLASKSAYVSSMGRSYVLVCYGSSYQPTYFLIDSSGNVLCKLAYSNGGGYAINQILPQLNVSGSNVLVGYLYKDLLAAVNKTQGASSAGIYSQTGINLASITFNDSTLVSEIGNDLHLTGGFLWMFDGVKAVEHGFHLWPDDVAVSTSGSGGSLAAQLYYYVATYEWTDNAGNIHRSAPSIPVAVTTTGTTSTNTINVPTLRLTYKINNPVRVVIYRWSTAQQSYYRITSISSPLLNDPTTDSVSFSDTVADSGIVGNDLVYTTGGVIENIAAPACKDVSLFKSRLFVVDAEDPNLLWYSKQVIQSVPVEMSDLLTIYVAPTTGAQGSTGETAFTTPMDDKLIIFKKDAIYYITGTGPDNTGANNDFSEPVFITATVGSVNKRSVVFIPNGIMFQSDKGIWLLGRDLSTTYIGAAVEQYNDQEVLSALGIPGTNQARFTLSGGLTLMYDYFYNQWGSFSGIPGISSVLYGGLHTFLNSNGSVLRETSDVYLDDSRPVLVSFQTGWMSLAGLQGYQRAYYFYILAQFLSPHKIQIQIAYDYAPTSSQALLITPDNYSSPWGGDQTWGSSSLWGGQPKLEQWRVFFQQQRCQSFQITLNEIFDSSYGVSAGAGLTISGLNIVAGVKKGWTPILAKNSAG